MPQIIKVEALPAEGIPYRCTPSFRKNERGDVVVDPSGGRFWPSGSAVTVEVLDQEEDGDMIAHEAINHVNQRREVRHLPDMEKIGRKTFEAIKENKFIRILSDVGTTDEEAAGALKAAREHVRKAASDLLDAKGEIETLKTENERLKKELGETKESLRMALLPMTNASPATDDRSAAKGSSKGKAA